MSTAKDAQALAAYVAAMQQQHGQTPLVRDGALVDQRDEDRFGGWRLRGEAQAEQQAVAWRYRLHDHAEGPGPWNLTDFREHAAILVCNGREVVPLYTRPQAALSSTAAPAPVAGDAVQLPEGAPPHWGDAMSVLETAAPAELQPLIFNVAYACDQRLSFLHMRVRDLEAALSQNRASQAAAPVAVPAGWVLVPMDPPQHALDYLRVPVVGNWHGMLSKMPVAPRVTAPQPATEREKDRG